MQVKIPKPEDLMPLYQQVTEDQTEEQYQSHFLKSVALMLNKNPLWYRAYGIYWFSLKQELVSRNLIDHEFIDAEQVEKVKYDNPCYLLLAAWAYHDERHEIGSGYDDLHVVEYEDGTIDGYQLVDEELEMLAVSKSFN